MAMESSAAVEGAVIYEQDGVLLSIKGLNGDNLNLFLGKLQILKEKNGIFMVWVSDDTLASLFPGAQEPDWMVIDPSQATVGYHNSNAGRPIRFEIQDLKCIRLSSLAEHNVADLSKRHGSGVDPDRTCSVSFVQTDGTTYPSLIFPGGSTSKLLDALKNHLELKRSCQDDSLILCEAKRVFQRRDPYEKTLAELRLFPDRNQGPLQQLSQLNLGQLGQLGVGAWRFVSDLKRDPYAATMTAFSKISDYLLHEEERPSDEIVELLQKSLSLDDSTPSASRTIEKDKEQDENSVIFGSSDSSVEGYEVIQPPVPDLIPRPKIVRGEPLNESEWRSYFDEEGKITNIQELKCKIFSGGIDPAIRSEVWKYLLGYFPWKMSHTERREHRDHRVEDYYRMKLQWKSFCAEQESRFTAFKQRKDLIEKDVNRTDRTVHYYSGENNSNVVVLHDVLMTYMMYDFDLGYVQGMSDLLAPILYVIDNEVDSFWCFAAYMDRMKMNFELDQSGIKQQLNQLRTLLHIVDPHLASYLETRDSGNLFFCFRWLLVLFKREFNYPQILKLWEIVWTDGPFWRHNSDQELKASSNFHLLLALSILDSQRNTILENRFGFTEILKHINDLALYIDLDETVNKAEGIFYQLKDSPSVTQEIKHILGLEISAVKERRSTSSDFSL